MWKCPNCKKLNGEDHVDRRDGTRCSTAGCQGEYGDGARIVFSDEELARIGPLHKNRVPFFRDDHGGYLYAPGRDDPVTDRNKDRPWHGPRHDVTLESRYSWAPPEKVAELPPRAQQDTNYHIQEGARREREEVLELQNRQNMPPPPMPTASTQGQSGNDFYVSQGATAQYGSTYGAMPQYNAPGGDGSAGYDAYGSASYSTSSPSTGQAGHSGYDYTASAPSAGYTTQQAYSASPAGYSTTSAGYSTTPAEYSTTQQQEYHTAAGYDAHAAFGDYTQPESQYYEDPDLQTQTQSQSQPTDLSQYTYGSRQTYSELQQQQEEQEDEQEDDAQYLAARSKRRHESTPSTGDSYHAGSPEPSRSHSKQKDSSKGRHKSHRDNKKRR
ncbi:hypothetical protein V8F33_012513 [Rhypophila sp. PSN 637]